MEFAFDAVNLTETSTLRVHELQEGYQAIIDKASASFMHHLIAQIMAEAHPVHVPMIDLQIDKLASEGAAHFDAAKEKLAQDLARWDSMHLSNSLHRAVSLLKKRRPLLNLSLSMLYNVDI